MTLSTLLIFLPAALLAVRLESNHLLWSSMALFMIARTLTPGLASQRLLSGVAMIRPTVAGLSRERMQSKT